MLEQTLDESEPRIFYWALMDYGTYLKQSIGNLNARSKHYTKQSRFEGSKRQIRGAVLRYLSSGPEPMNRLLDNIADERLPVVIEDLKIEGLIKESRGVLRLA